MGKKPLPVGVEDFSKLKEEGYYYIDKTSLIKGLLDKKGDVNLFLRPRRFGKTLNLSMIKYYFEKSIDSNEDNSHLFEDTKIWSSGEKYRKEFAQYPVINMSFKNAIASDPDDMYGKIKEVISKEYKRHGYLLDSAKLSNQDKKDFENIRDQKSNKLAYENSLLKLCDLLYQYHNQKVVIIIDEYDAPLQKAFVNDFHEEVISFLKSFLGNAMKTNEHMKFGVIGGCMKILQASIFSEFNNPRVNSLISPGYAEMFGFTEKEVNELLEYYEFEDKKDLVKEWYNGYNILDSQIYNPWSVISYAADLNEKPTLKPKPYWKNTSSNDLVKELIRDSDGKTKDTLENLIKGKTIKLRLDEGIIYDNLKNATEEKILNIFFFSGYLTQIGVNDDIYEIKIPNKEINKIYESIIDEWFQEKFEAVNLKDLYSKILTGDAKGFEDKINEILMDSISTWDSNEQFYHGFILSLLQQAEGYKIVSNRESGTGRFDLEMYHKGSRNKPAAIMEFKVLPKDKPFIILEDVCKKALKQIEDKKYYHDLKSIGYKTIFKYGITFDGKVCSVLLGE